MRVKKDEMKEKSVATWKFASSSKLLTNLDHPEILLPDARVPIQVATQGKILKLSMEF